MSKITNKQQRHPNIIYLTDEEEARLTQRNLASSDIVLYILEIFVQSHSESLMSMPIESSYTISCVIYINDRG